jgi:hypothetical protein
VAEAALNEQMQQRLRLTQVFARAAAAMRGGVLERERESS